MNIKFALAISLAAMLVSNSVAIAAPRVTEGGGPITRPGGNHGTTSAGHDITVTAGTLVLNPLRLSCHLDYHDMTPHATVWFTNIGDVPIPAGTWITVTWPDGTTYKFKTQFDIPPHDAVGLWVPDGISLKGFHCSARASGK